ncbi:MAG: FCD domain-containing protein [Actinomycetota bacterium]|nr:FCD domain-containing protein [Actinomycetota bacterium]
MKRVFETFVHGHQISLDALLAARLIVEPEVAALAAENSSPATLSVLYAATAEHEAATEIESHLVLHAAWHKAVGDASGNVVLASLVDALTHISYAGTRSLYVRTAKHMDLVCKSHRRILSAIANADVDGARRCMREHIEAYRSELAAKRLLKASVPLEDRFGLGSAEVLYLGSRPLDAVRHDG